MAGVHVRTLIVGLAAGAAATALFDPRQGRRRRALGKDKLAHWRRTLPRQLARYERRAEGAVLGAIHEMGGGAGRATPDELERYVVERVMSELGHDATIPLGALNFDAVDGLVYIRGRVDDAATAERIVAMAGRVAGVRGVISLMRLASGDAVGGSAGRPDIYDGVPRAVVQAEAVRKRLMAAFPGLTDADILASDGYVHLLAASIARVSGRPVEEIMPELEELTLAAV